MKLLGALKDAIKAAYSRGSPNAETTACIDLFKITQTMLCKENLHELASSGRVSEAGFREARQEIIWQPSVSLIAASSMVVSWRTKEDEFYRRRRARWAVSPTLHIHSVVDSSSDADIYV